MGHYIHDDRQLDIKYDELPDVSYPAADSMTLLLSFVLQSTAIPLHVQFALQNYTADTINYSAPLSKADFEAAMTKYDISMPPLAGNITALSMPIA